MQDFKTVQCFEEDTLIVPLVALASSTKVGLVHFYTTELHQLA